jgi:hypothetical protein
MKLPDARFAAEMTQYNLDAMIEREYPLVLKAVTKCILRRIKYGFNEAKYGAYCKRETAIRVQQELQKHGYIVGIGVFETILYISW